MGFEPTIEVNPRCRFSRPVLCSEIGVAWCCPRRIVNVRLTPLTRRVPTVSWAISVLSMRITQPRRSRTAAGRMLILAALTCVAAYTSCVVGPNTASAESSWQGHDIIYAAGGCGGTCNLKGTRGSISPPGSGHWTIANNSSAWAMVQIGNDTNGACYPDGCLLQAGFIQTNSWDGDCIDNNSAPDIDMFWERVGSVSQNCYDYPHSASDTLFRVQKTNESGSHWTVVVSGVQEQSFSITDFNTGSEIAAREEIVNHHIASEYVSASFTTTYPWSRTSDLYGDATTWTTVHSSQCGDGVLDETTHSWTPGTYWYIDSPPSPIGISWAGSGGTSC